MNFLILINSALNYKYFFHKIGESLEKRGHNVYYAIDSERSKYVEPLIGIDENDKSFFFNVYLKKFYNENLVVQQSNDFWSDYFYSDFDRFLFQNFNLDKKKKKFWENVKVLLDSFFKELIFSKKIDCVIYENISNSFAFSAYMQCKNLNKKYIGLMASRIPNYFEIQNSVIEEELIKILKFKETPANSEEIFWFENYKNNIKNIQPDYMIQNDLAKVSLKRIFEKNKVIRAFRFMTAFYKYDYTYDYQVGNPLFIPLKGLKILIKRYLTISLSDKYYISSRCLEYLKENEIFYIYPIHYHPESSTSVLAPEYTNEYVNIINIANNLPFGTYLYVKDHESAKGIQDIEFYKKISRIPNVRLIKYSANIKDLILSSKGVITINSTAGYEALLLDKPVYLFGRVFYENFRNVFKLNNARELRKILFLQTGYSDKMDFIAYRRYCYKGKIDIKNHSYIENVVDTILVNSTSQ